ncbi:MULTISPECIES: multiple stress resistance protein BhsA [Xenorhabdus]|uniref:multiple stress resistance protein BhsA n=1 Tax=Xenorhabdus TaxID=626 RepID=UPI00064632B1|nr:MULTISPECIES: DUF1471 domain-containing protein [Xenorhabdus]MBC8944784.1 Multiple stress resistance protein BhsA [Xenorhabdus indica]
MRNAKFIAAVLTLCTVSFGSFAAIEVRNATGEKIGVVSVTGAETLDNLTEELSKKADKAGAAYFRIISATGHDKLHGVAEIYK